jgi:glycosyltransferase involved in cell wall biosynthesis
MRICIVTVAGRGLGGMQDHTRALARSLAARGNEVHVIAGGRADLGDPDDGAHWHWLDVPTAHPRLPRRHPEWFRSSFDAFARLQRDVQFDVVHSESTSALELMRRGVNRSVPVVIKLHGNYLGELRQALGRIRRGSGRQRLRDAKKIVWHTGMHLQRGEWHRFRPCEWIVTSEHEFRDARIESFLVPSRGHVIPNGIDTDVFHPENAAEARRRLGVADDGPLLVCAGRLDPLKGTAVAVRALALLRDRDRFARLAIVGGGSDLDNLTSLARELGLSDEVVFVPPQPHAVLAEWLAAADAFLFPTQLNEAAPLVPLQAMACGTPVIASDVGTLREMLGRNGDAGGMTVPADSPEELANAVERLTSDPGLLAALSGRALERVQTYYTLDRMVDRTLQVYEIARARHGGR